MNGRPTVPHPRRPVPTRDGVRRTATATATRPATAVAARRPGPFAWVVGLVLGLVLVGGIVALGVTVDHRDVPRSLQPTIAMSTFDVQVSDECNYIGPLYNQAACVRDLPQSVAQMNARTRAASTFGVVHFWQRAGFIAACLLFVVLGITVFGGYLVAEQRSGGVR